ncbi:MAG: hypothetical protein M1812_003090 [Candelaria pacifica]|nr:MAG: hypothetical protein M1812_003090 [Candelaria pacifica]
MSTKHLSPTASLLRNSRLFSLPPPLPRPSHDFTSTSPFASDTATLPYPTHAAIATPQSSLSRGDWGLKRPLPLRSTTNTSTPTIRITAIDSLEHITNFDSAADHALTLRKWQEMNMPMLVPSPRTRKASQLLADANQPDKSLRRSVFERNIDNTYVDNDGNEIRADKRWKFRGPWLAGKTEGQFNQYVEKVIRRRKSLFRKYVRQDLANRKDEEQKAIARDMGQSDEAVEPTTISEEVLNSHLKSLRRNRHALSRLVHDFFDLPAPPTTEAQYSSGLGGGDRLASASTSTYAQSGPPKTHPSAGLSYLRTSSHIYNHPVLGPQTCAAPVRARVLQPQRSTTGYNTTARLGVGGIVGDGSQPRSFNKRNKADISETERALSEFDPTIPGGAKIWVRPDRASIDAQGRIKIETQHADPIAVRVHEGKIEPEDKPFSIPLPQSSSYSRMRDLSPPKSSNATSTRYGLGSSRGDLEADSSGSSISHRETQLLNGEVYKTIKSLQDSNGT